MLCESGDSRLFEDRGSLEGEGTFLMSWESAEN